MGFEVCTVLELHDGAVAVAHGVVVVHAQRLRGGARRVTGLRAQGLGFRVEGAGLLRAAQGCSGLRV